MTLFYLTWSICHEWAAFKFVFFSNKNFGNLKKKEKRE